MCWRPRPSSAPSPGCDGRRWHPLVRAAPAVGPVAPAAEGAAAPGEARRSAAAAVLGRRRRRRSPELVAPGLGPGLSPHGDRPGTLPRGGSVRHDPAPRRHPLARLPGRQRGAHRGSTCAAPSCGSWHSAPTSSGRSMAVAVIPALYAGGDGVVRPARRRARRLSTRPVLVAHALRACSCTAAGPHLREHAVPLDLRRQRRGSHGPLASTSSSICCAASSPPTPTSSSTRVSRMPSIGASGAIAGVLGAYLTLYPARARRGGPPAARVLLPARARCRPCSSSGLWFLQQFLFGHS